MFIFIIANNFLTINKQKMNPILRNVLAVVAGIMVGMLVNGGLVSLGGSIIPLPSGVDGDDVESIKANIHLYKFKHFIFPFLAHALGTLAAAFVAAKIAVNHKMRFAIAMGVLFIIFGIMMVVLVGGPLWFIVLDLVVAYIPMGWLGGNLATRNLNPAV
ncbi:MAG: hypothetical protein ACI8P3_004038 [Saprospiraceae bacterium]